MENAQNTPAEPFTALRLALEALEHHTEQTRPIERTTQAIAALRQAIASEQPVAQQAPSREPWQPIETAPKDGTLFLCWVSAVRYGETDEGQQYEQDVSQVDFCNWRTQADIEDCGWFDPCCGQIGDAQGITHWMPLPAAPGITKEGGKA